MGTNIHIYVKNDQTPVWEYLSSTDIRWGAGKSELRDKMLISQFWDGDGFNFDPSKHDLQEVVTHLKNVEKVIEEWMEANGTHVDWSFRYDDWLYVKLWSRMFQDLLTLHQLHVQCKIAGF